jgi:uncharacterized UPF0160 family protein
LDKVTGITAGAVFCHKGRFICGHQTHEGILRMAQQALDYQEV